MKLSKLNFKENEITHEQMLGIQGGIGSLTVSKSTGCSPNGGGGTVCTDGDKLDDQIAIF